MPTKPLQLPGILSCLFLLQCLFPGKICAQPTVAFPEVITGLNSPLDIVNAGDGSNRLFVVQQGGTIVVYSSAYASLGTFLTVSNVGTGGGEEGLLSMVFHPSYASNGFFWVFYTNTAGNLELARYQVSGNPNVADPASKQVVLTINHPTNSNHNGGKLLFGTDGYLYLSTGDGGGSGDPGNNAQNTSSLLGKILRLDVSLGGTAPFYTVPPGNPFGNEVFAYGLRNPFRWSFDQSGNSWIGDVGQNAHEEINRVTSLSGLNFGWRCYEGNATFNTSGCPPMNTLTFPVYTYPNLSGPAAVTGGMVYNGSAYPSLQGYYYAADVYSGNIYLINTTNFTPHTQSGVQGGIVGFGESEAGEIFVADINGSVRQLVPASALPVKIGQFELVRQGSGALLRWSTVSEINVSHFEIERSVDGSRFSKTGERTAVNHSNGASYNYLIPQLPPGDQYFRLKIVDTDGRASYTSILVLKEDKSKLIMYPLPLTGDFLYIIYNPGYQEIRLFTLSGQLLEKRPLSPGGGSLQWSLGSREKGTYIIQLAGYQSITTRKILIY